MKTALKNLQKNSSTSDIKPIPNEVKDIPVDVLIDDNRELISSLRQHNIYNIGDLNQYDASSLQAVLKIVNPDTVKQLVKDKDMIIRDFMENTIPKINLENLTEDEQTLLNFWYFNTTYENEVDFIENETVIVRAEALLDTMKQKRGPLMSLFQSSHKKEKIDEAFKEFETILPELNRLEESVNTLFNELGNNLSAQNAFIGDSASFYAFIESEIGAKSIKQGGDLPSELVENIMNVDLDVSLLTGGTLRPYQLFGSKYAVYNKRTLLGDEMGLGKTIQALAVITHLFKQNQTRAFVVCPKSVITNWAHEIEKWTDIPVKIYHGAKREQAYNEWIETPSILITNPEHTKNLNFDAIDYIDCLIIDEAHLIKNPRAARTKNVMLLAEKSEYVMMMTGTPIENNLNEMKHLIGILQPHIIKEIESNPRMNVPDTFKRIISPVYLRRKRVDVLNELPDIEFIEKYSEMSKIERENYNEAVLMGLAGLMKMRQAAFTGYNVRYSEKLANIVEICTEAKENGHKILIFSYFIDNLRLIHRTLGKESAGIIYGGVSTNERQEIIDAFTKREAGAALIGQIDAAGVGLNIQAANIVILCEPQWKPSTELQAISRAYRMGQTKNVIVYRLLSKNSIDEAITEVRDEKLKSFNLYANDSNVADVFEAEEIEINESEIKKEVLEIERKRLEENAGA